MFSKDEKKEKIEFRNLLAFWIFGLSCNYVNTIMLTASEDIIHEQSGEFQTQNKTFSNSSEYCIVELGKPRCDKLMSTGTILLASGIPAMIVKYSFPFFMNRIPFGFRIFLVIFLHASILKCHLLELFFVLFLLGIGQICLPALTSHYPKSSVAAWTAGTGAASIIPSLAYSALTEPKLFNFDTRTVVLLMLIIPLIFAFSYWFILESVPTVHKMNLLKPSSWVVPTQKSSSKEDNISVISMNINLNKNYGTLEITNINEFNVNYDNAFTHEFSILSKLKMAMPLLRYMIPVTVVYFAEYVVTSGLSQLIHFDCEHSFGLSLDSQFRWYFTVYLFGVFCSRSTIVLINVPLIILYLLPIIQCLIMAILYFHSIYFFIPHIFIVFALIFILGVISGISYAGTLDRVHRKSSLKTREFNMAVVASSDTTGICLAGFASIFVHNYICNQHL
ncbi:Battenin [Meloidogyne graminicola]|uniref:Battenin n=1 Tax=Meloidogyne graminicola TaxID=189291 RepID=A0A8S9ZHC2_9BILA|nr:Battenin [Meloidogyne graminicola]